jgi:hypothetical protein
VECVMKKYMQIVQVCFVLALLGSAFVENPKAMGRLPLNTPAAAVYATATEQVSLACIKTTVKIYALPNSKSRLRGTLRPDARCETEILEVVLVGNMYWGRIGMNMYIPLEFVY